MGLGTWGLGLVDGGWLRFRSLGRGAGLLSGLLACCATMASALAPDAPIVTKPSPSPQPPSPAVLVGGHAHGAANIRALAELGLGNFVWIPKAGYGMGNTPWDAEHGILADVDACVANGFSFMVSQRRGLGPAFKPGGPEYGGDTTPDIHSPETVREIARRAGPLFVGLHAEELDADFLQNALRASSRSRTPWLYDFTDRVGGRRRFERELRRIGDLAHRSGPGVRFLPNLCVSLQHSGFRAGGDLVMGELLEALPATELQLAYLRGGASQFAKPWGVWVSPWHKGQVPTEDKTLWPGPNSAPGAGHDASRFKRCLYLAWASGARVLTMQETEPLYSRDGDGYKLAAWGRVLKAFWEDVKRHPEPMEPIVPVALLVDRDCGWAPGHLHGDWIEHQTVWGKLPPTRGDAMLAAYLDALLPGFERTTGWWKPGGKDYPGTFAPTPAGPFDIVSSDITAARLARYPSVVLMGEVAMTPALLRTLKAYVRQGGMLHLNVNQMRLREAFVQAPDFLGATIGLSHQWSEWSKGDLSMRRTESASQVVLQRSLRGMRPSYDEPWFVVQDVQAVDAEVVAATPSRLPVLLRHAYGKGSVWLSTPDYVLEGSQTPARRLEFFVDLFRALGAASPVRVAARGGGALAADVSWVAARQGGDVVVAVANHGMSAIGVEVSCGSVVSAAVVGAEGVEVVRLPR